MTHMKPSGSPLKRRRAYRKSGFHTTKAALSRRGISALDGRSAIARAVKDWRAAVAVDLGGEAVLSRAELTLLDIAAQDIVLLSVADSWLRENAAGIINRRRRAFVPLVEQRLKVATHLAGLLETLGLKRAVKDVPSLAQLLASRAARPHDARPAPPASEESTRPAGAAAPASGEAERPS
jgi:hypothetical protein